MRKNAIKKIGGGMVIALLITVTVLLGGMEISASTMCDEGIHTPLAFYDEILEYQEKTGEHEYSTGKGQAVCYIYTNHYVIRYRCQSCGAITVYNRISKSDVHSACGIK